MRLSLQGDCEDHATLLCSLLLGFGLDAYVCVGTKAKGMPHCWVLTRGTDGTITFWESLTAHRFVFHFSLAVKSFLMPLVRTTRLLLSIPASVVVVAAPAETFSTLEKFEIRTRPVKLV